MKMNFSPIKTRSACAVSFQGKDASTTTDRARVHFPFNSHLCTNIIGLIWFFFPVSWPKDFHQSFTAIGFGQRWENLLFLLLFLFGAEADRVRRQPDPTEFFSSSLISKHKLSIVYAETAFTLYIEAHLLTRFLFLFQFYFCQPALIFSDWIFHARIWRNFIFLVYIGVT